jgi:hypothetical protein
MTRNFIGLSITTVFSIPTVSLFLVVIAGILNPVSAKVQITRKSVSQDQVTLNVRVTDQNQRSLLNLREDDFKVFVDGKPVDILDWKSAKDSQPKARVLFLIDFSGSMKRRDQRGTTKFQGAVEAIEAFVEGAKRTGGDLKIAILPFGEGYNNCPAHVVNAQTISGEGFKSSDDPNLEQKINELKNYNVNQLCASTNLYQPLSAAVEYMGDIRNTDFHPPLNPRLPEYDSRQPQQPQLNIILLSDGYHNGDNEEQGFEDLETLLKRYPKINVHTLGYGKTPEELGREIGKKQATRADLYYGSGTPPTGQISAEDFVDRDRLAQIAQITNGIAEFSNNPNQVASALIDFLYALKEYEITYLTPNAEEGKLYLVEVEVTTEKETEETEKPQTYKISWDTLPLPTRIWILILTLIALSVLGFLPWWLWGKTIKNQEQ